MRSSPTQSGFLRLFLVLFVSIDVLTLSFLFETFLHRDLPVRHQATTLGRSLEDHFYGRVPPSKRPAHLRRATAQNVPISTSAPTLHSKRRPVVAVASSTSTPTINVDNIDDTDPKKLSTDLEIGPDIPLSKLDKTAGIDPISQDKGKKSGKIKPGKDGKPGVEYEDGKYYDQNLLRALNRLVFWRCVVLD